MKRLFVMLHPEEGDLKTVRYRKEIPNFDSLFVDLNRDDVSPIEGFADRGEIYLPNTALRADLVVSLAKMKTHHWAGATLAMKNFFGLVPGSVYGWPKNELHQVGIDRSIVELNRIFRRSFAIVDGIVGMEGNGPIQGTPKQCGVLVMGSDLPAVDATCCRIIRLARLEKWQKKAPGRIGGLSRGLSEGGGGSVSNRGYLPNKRSTLWFRPQETHASGHLCAGGGEALQALGLVNPRRFANFAQRWLQPLFERRMIKRKRQQT